MYFDEWYLFMEVYVNVFYLLFRLILLCWFMYQIITYNINFEQIISMLNVALLLFQLSMLAGAMVHMMFDNKH